MSKMEGITVRVLGDYGPFSRMGKSIGYQLILGESSILVDCGAPIFQQIGGHGLKNISGVIITHCHEDHKRWFTDLALFNRYAPDVGYPVTLITAENIHKEIERSAAAALQTSLSPDSLKVVDIGYNEYVDQRILGPQAKYRIVSIALGAGLTQVAVFDRNDHPVGPDIAKIVINPDTSKPRLLFKDPNTHEWVEPESYYPFSSAVFYEKDQNRYQASEGFWIEAINAPVWHGIPCMGIKCSTSQETLIFSSDTNHDLDLWKRLYTEKRRQRHLLLSEKAFEEASVIFGDINDYIERMWSEERYADAVAAFGNAVVIHDIAAKKSVVHTDYNRLSHTGLERKRTVLTHSPDKMTSEWVLGEGEKVFKIIGNNRYEQVGDDIFPLNADLYHKENGRYFVGYRNPEGEIAVFENDGLLSLSIDPNGGKGRFLFRVDLYEDIDGRYYPRHKNERVIYRKRADGGIEMVTETPEGSFGKIVEDMRPILSTSLTAL